MFLLIINADVKVWWGVVAHLGGSDIIWCTQAYIF